MQIHHFYAVIIGSEILNGRRNDKHFDFIRNALLQYGHTLYASIIIKDDPILIRNTFDFIKQDPHSVLFSFGGIGSTPDDLTRQIASDSFSDGELIAHPDFTSDIIERFGNEAYPHRILMAHLPKKANLLKNVVNNMSGFFLENRYFFMPGFPEMSHPMVLEALKRFYPSSPTLYRKTLIADTSENTLIEIMKLMDENVEFSSLPILINGKATVEISVASYSKSTTDESIKRFTEWLEREKIEYKRIN